MLVLSLDQENTLEEEMPTHSSILAWEVSWTEEAGGLQSMVLQRVGHDGTHMHITHIFAKTLQMGILMYSNFLFDKNIVKHCIR